jgi:high affinity sulfate transporter 1
MRRVPGALVLRNYQRGWLAHDLIAGLVLTTILVPIGMGYAEAGHLPPITGLYASIAAMLAYAVFGPGKLLVLGPDSALAALIASIVLPLAAGDPARLMPLASMLALLSGICCIIVGLLRLGFITDLLSKPIRDGYINGVALTIITGQTPKMLGFNIDTHTALSNVVQLIQGIFAGLINGVTCAIGFTCLLAVFVCKRYTPRVPGVLVAVVGATLVCALFDLDQRYHVSIVGEVPQGVPSLALPAISFGDVTALLPGVIAITLISLADFSVTSRVFADRYGGHPDRNQDFVALGIANVACGLFQGFSVVGSSSRTPVAEAAGAKTQLNGVVAALCLCVLLMFAPALVRSLPTATLGAVVVASAFGIFDPRSIFHLLRLRPSEFIQSAACFIGVAVIGVMQGIFVALLLALAAFVWRAWRPHDAVLGRVDGRKGYHDVARNPQARRVPGLVLFRWDAPLFFANAEIFHDRALKAMNEADTPTRCLVIASEPITDIDITAAGILKDMHHYLRARDIEFAFAEMKGPEKDLLRRYGLYDKIGNERFYPTIGAAVSAYLKRHQVQWRDWEG